MIRTGSLYRDRDGRIVEILASSKDGVTVRYSDGTIVTVSA